MVDAQLRRRGIADEQVLDAMLRMPRHRFISSATLGDSYGDFPLPIGEGQTISQPYIVAVMTEGLRLTGGESVLEIGTGSGYQTAILASLASRVISIERSASLSRRAGARLRDLGIDNVELLVGDGTLGHTPAAPFDRILATGSLPEVPARLIEQLRPGGIFIGPIGGLREQRLVRIVYHPAGSTDEDLGGCRFVPLVGDDGWPGPTRRRNGG